MVQNFSDLIGHTITKIDTNDSDVIRFTLEDGTKCHLYHEQDCCERVSIESVSGDLQDLVGKPITNATEDSESSTGDYESQTDTEYVIKAGGVRVKIKWVGTSNGYYSENVNFRVEQPKA
jgi:hypothetical protein